MDIRDILEQRRATYGSWTNVAHVASAIKEALRQGESYDGASPEVREGLDLIANKMARAVCGDPKYPDNYVDGIGYFTLILDHVLGE